MITAHRYHDICCGHRVHNHESKCAHLHGHNYRFHFYVAALAGLDSVGRVLDFEVIKKLLCQWLEENYDHKFLIWCNDPMATALRRIDPAGTYVVSFNPTAENIAEDFLMNVAPMLLAGTGTQLVKVTIEETRKCGVTAELDNRDSSDGAFRF